ISADFGLSVDPFAVISDLTVGERQRVEILKALYRDVRILILDEPTAVLTPGETEVLFRTLKLLVSRGLSILFISHKLHEVLAVSERVLVLRHGKLAGSVATRQTTRSALPAMMVADAVETPEVRHREVGATLLELGGVSAAPSRGGTRLEQVDL